jgi:hypothetical protein
MAVAMVSFHIEVRVRAQEAPARDERDISAGAMARLDVRECRPDIL